MIEVEANILRGSCTPVYFVGEQIECEIKFACVSNGKEKLFDNKNLHDLEQQQMELKQKDNYLLDYSFNSIENQNTENPKTLNEITESMFSLLSNLNANNKSELNTPSSSSVASTPVTVPNSLLYKNINYAKSFQSFLTTPDKNKTTFLPKINSTKSLHESAPTQTDHIIAWACAQIDCNCYIDESRVVLPKDPLRYGHSDKNSANDQAHTSFQPNKDRVGISVFSSKPKILFCNLLLRPNESRSFVFRETLPYDLAPTFRGQLVKYSYKLTVGVQKLNKSTELLRLPFRVYSLMDFEKYIPKAIAFNDDTHLNSRNESLISLSDTVNNTTCLGYDLNASFDVKDLFVKNPFKIEEKSEYENLEYALQILEDQTARISISSFNVANQDGKIVKISLNKTNYKIGDKIVVYLDFSDSEVQCLEFKVVLQSEEIISEECRKKPNQPLSSIQSHAELKECSFYMKKTDVTMQVPVHVTPTFVSDIVSLRWRLHFEFALSKMTILKIQRSNDAAMSVSWRPPGYLPIEVLSWDLPIMVHPFDPFVASDLIYSTKLSETNNCIILKE